MKPKVFIGSSTESLEIAYALQENLERDSDVTVWDQGLFELSRTTLDTLVDKLDNFDFGIFVLGPDDVAKIRGQEHQVPRDNVVFELGLLIGKLGKERAFLVEPAGQENIHLPTDLLGLTFATFNPDREDKNIVAALGPACNKIRRSVQELGLLHKTEIVIDEIKPGISFSKSLNKFISSDMGKPTVVIAHCADTEKYTRNGVAAPGGTLIKIITDKGIDSPELIAIHKLEADWNECYDAKTIFVVDSPTVNPDSKYILDNYRNVLTGGAITHVTEEHGDFRVQMIIANHQKLFSNKHSKTTKEKLFGDFIDYLVVMRLPGAIISNNEIDDNRVIWLIYGTTTKGTHAGAYLFREDNIDKMDALLFDVKKTNLSDARFFEMVFEISDKTNKVEDFKDFSLVHFAELRPKIECCAGDPSPAGIENFFQRDDTKKNIPIYSVHLDPLAACNFQCPDCIESHVRDMGLMLSMRGISRILTDLYKIGCQDLHFYGGEPTLHPDFSLIVDLASAMGFRMMLVTNGSQLSDPNIARSLANAQNMHVRVSLDAHSRTSHKKYHGIKQSDSHTDIEDIKKAIIGLIRNNVTVSISYLLFKDSLHEIEKACEFWKANGATSFNPRVPMGRNGIMRKKLNVIFDNEEKELLRSVLEKYKSFVIIPDWMRTWLYSGDEPKTKKEFPVCYSGYYRIGISPYADAGTEAGLPIINIPSVEKELRATDNAWISTCLYYRYDERFGCVYPDDFAQWCNDGRLTKLASIQTGQRGFCDNTVCSRLEANNQVYSSILKGEATARDLATAP